MADKSSKAAQDRTLCVAQRRGLAWTTREIEYLEAHFNDRTEDVARALNRTLFAVWGMRYALRNGRGVHEGRDVRRTQRRTLPYDRGFTTIPDTW